MAKKALAISLFFCATLCFCAELSSVKRRLELINPTAVELALTEMHRQWPESCPDPDTFPWLKTISTERDSILKRLSAHDSSASAKGQELIKKVRNALTSLPLLPSCDMIAIERSANNLAMPVNWGNLRETSRKALTNRIIRIKNLKNSPQISSFWEPQSKEDYAGHLRLHWDGERLMFTSNDDQGLYRVYELSATDPSQKPILMPQIEESDVDNYSGCWLADDDYLFLSTATMIGVPCVRGSSKIANIYKHSNGKQAIRRLTFEQEHNWCPTMLEDGSVMYLRWEYSDIPHFVARILFTMNPDGTTQRELYGSGSYWPNSMFHARPIPGQPHQFAAIVSGHHDTCREGELILFDPSLGRHEADGVIQRIPGRGKKVEPEILDRLVSDSWPKFLFPWPLDKNFFLVSCKPDKDANWGIYLVDTFDNLTLLHEVPGKALLEITPLEKQKRPPVRPSLVEEGQPARVKIIDIYQGPGLAGVPRGSVKRLRVFTYAFSYRGMGGQVDRVGLDGPWDVKRIIGTVPVSPDGSAFFEVPANTPVAFQPLDEKGRALQLMRSWTTVMPGELQSCTGCHEPQNMGSGPRLQMSAIMKEPARIKPWYGPTRGFSFNREVQPVLDQACIKCHNGTDAQRPDFTQRPDTPAGSAAKYYNNEAHFPPAYLALQAYVRSPTMESDMHLLEPCEYHASTTELAQMLENGHHGVTLSEEQWSRINTWIDLNTPAHGTWTEIAGTNRVAAIASRRAELIKRYAGVDEDLEDKEFRSKFTAAQIAISTNVYRPPSESYSKVNCTLKPFTPETRKIRLGNNIEMHFVKIPSGTLQLSEDKEIHFSKVLWAGIHEVSNQEFARFDPAHDSRIEAGDFLQFSVAERGFPCNTPTHPVCRVSAQQAAEFCKWLSEKSALKCRLPDENEWQWLARAGSDEEYLWGSNSASFNQYANLADKSFNRVLNLGWGLPVGAIPKWRPARCDIDDGFRVSSPTASFKPNRWGLYDTTGNVWEWSGSSTADGRTYACGGSWHTRPCKATFNATLAYPSWQKVYDVGFRVVIEE
jgi:formylglycine-generating enzyme required for sulfatase activity